MKRLLLLVLLFLTFVQFTAVSQETDENLIQMAILLDTSGSMEGLIEQAKTQLWKIVNELAISKRNGKSPKLEVGLYEYGKSSISRQEDYLRMIVPLTVDLDKVSDELFKLTTNGGDEYCGAVIKASLNGLKWKKDNKILKLIFIAGNEPFTQGGIDYKKSCKDAIEKGIIVNTIFCGNFDEGVRTNWKDGAEIADGKYMNIDHNQQLVYIKAPQDEEILALNKKLNDTYIAYGSAGKEKKENQMRQDSNAASVNKESEVQRAVTKSSKLYENSSWDLADAYDKGTIDINKIDEKDLPEEMKKMSKKEREEYINKKIKEREEIQNKINTLNKQREEYLINERKKSADSNTLDKAIINAIRSQASKKGYAF
ncbi:MAG: VWA domain-containing protein [Spirochaetes bacterium]|nr:VWA domain-containing protein [Spirochaetota bacterium]